MRDLLQTLAGLAFSTLIGTYVLQWATRWVAKFTPSFGVAFTAVLVANVFNLAFSAILGEIVEIPEHPLTPVVIVFLVPMFMTTRLYTGG